MYSSFMAAMVLSAAAAMTAAEWLWSFSSRMPMMLEIRKGLVGPTTAEFRVEGELWPERR